MALKLLDAAGPKRIKSQQELDKAFASVTAAVEKGRSADAHHALDVYNRVVADGRFVKEFATDPGGAAQKLGLKLSPAQIEEIQAMAKASTGVHPDCLPVIVIAVCIVIAFGPKECDVVIDTSGKIKL